MGTKRNFGKAMVLAVAQWGITIDSETNTAVDLIKAAVAGKRHYLYAVEAVCSGAALTADVWITIYNGATALYKGCLGTGKTTGSIWQLQLAAPLEFSENTQLKIHAPGGGAGTWITLNAIGATI